MNIIFSFILLLSLIRMIVAKNVVQDENPHKRIMIPYKSVYGVPRRCTGRSNHKTTEENYRICQINAIKKWKITFEHYYTESWNFCCFVYDVLECETKVLYECDADYSDRNDKETRRLFDKSCQPIMANNPCSKSKDGGDDWIWKGLAIGAGVGLFLYLLYSCIQFWRKEYNTEFIAKEAYKAEKFRQKYEKEYIRAVYDHEVEFQDKQYFTNAPKQTSENGEAQPIKKQETAKMSKKDLKKINKKINSQIEADSKNDSSFWDDFNKDPDKYKQPTGFKTKAKKYFKRLWPFSNGNSEEQLKREELIRSEARRQYENIRKNRLELDKISTGNESSIEEINEDPLMAKMLRTLNQEQADIYRETIKTTNIPESGKKDQLKEWTKNFKDNRNKFRNEFDKKFEMTFGEESDNKLIKKGNLLKSSTHGSKKTEDESTKILRSDSDKDNRTQTPVSMIRRTESTSKPKGSQTKESLKKVGSQFKKQQSTSSVLSEQASLSKPVENQTTEILSSDSSQVEKPSNLNLIDEQKSTSKPANDQVTIIQANDLPEVKKPESTIINVNEQQSTSKPADDQVTKILSSDETSDSSIVSKNSMKEINNKDEEKMNKINQLMIDLNDKNDEIVELSSSSSSVPKEMSWIEKIATHQRLWNVSFDKKTSSNETENETNKYSEIAKKTYSDGFEYKYYELENEKDKFLNTWKIIKDDYKNKLERLKLLSQTIYDKKIEYEIMKNEYETLRKQYKQEKKLLNKMIDKEKNKMINDMQGKQKRISKQTVRFGMNNKQTENDIRNELENEYYEQRKQLEKKLTNNSTTTTTSIEQEKNSDFKMNNKKKLWKKIFKTKDKKTQESSIVFEPLEYRIEPILTDEEKHIVSQAIEQSTEKKEYRSSILKEMLEFEKLAKLDKGKTKEAILFRDDYFKPLYQEIVDKNHHSKSTSNEIKPILTDDERKYFHLMINSSNSKHKFFRYYIISEFTEIERLKQPLSESDRNTLNEFKEIFKKRLSIDPNKPEYPISKFRRKLVDGPNPVISAEQEDFLYYESMIKPKIYNKPVDYNVWFFKELFTTKGKYFYDPTHSRFSIIDRKTNDLFLARLLAESMKKTEYGKSNSFPFTTFLLDIVENRDVLTYQPKSNYGGGGGGHSKSSTTISSQSSNTDSLSKRMQRSMNQAFLQTTTTTTQMPEHPFTDFS
ncbi:uncharacterized protein LOC113791606 [Dermatophagoides pteronyssinus]|uniref:uncharacterized protein LOC113791606 n=1 Tax=Dermatophagoides pteronyssinus TaxID=6956 RepID=UPI003F666DCB